jgi:hypothetical protein
MRYQDIKNKVPPHFLINNLESAGVTHDRKSPSETITIRITSLMKNKRKPSVG